MNEEATIRICRRVDFLNRMREYIVFVDNEKVAYIRDKQIKEIKVTPGNHSVFIKVGISKTVSLNLTLTPGEAKNLEYGPSILTSKFYFVFWSLLILARLAQNHGLPRVAETGIGLVLVVLFVVLIAGMFFIRGAGYYLREVNDLDVQQTDFMSHLS
jgi:hypothetical protein